MKTHSRGLVRTFVHCEECMEGAVDLPLGYICYNPNKTRKEQKGKEKRIRFDYSGEDVVKRDQRKGSTYRNVKDIQKRRKRKRIKEVKNNDEIY